MLCTFSYMFNSTFPPCSNLAIFSNSQVFSSPLLSNSSTAFLNFHECPFCSGISFLSFSYRFQFSGEILHLVIYFLEPIYQVIFKSLSKNSEANQFICLLLSLWVSILGSSSGWCHLARPSSSLVVTGWSQLASGVWSCRAVSQGASALLHVAFLATQLRHVHMAVAFHDDGNSWGELQSGVTAKDLHPSLTSPCLPSGHNFLRSPQSKIHSPLQETPKSHAIRDGTLSKVQHLTIGPFFFSASAQCLVPKPALCISGF